MSEKVLTIMIGDWASISTIEFPSGKWDILKTTAYPLNPIKALLNPKCRNLPFLGNIPDDLYWVDKPELNLTTGEATGRKIRILSADNFMNRDLVTASKIPAMVDWKLKYNSLEKERAMLFNELMQVLDHIDNVKMEDVKTREMIKLLDISKKAREKLYFASDYLKQMGGGQ
jgi:hypothetical protein